MKISKFIDTDIGKRIAFIIKEMNMTNNQFSAKMQISTSVTHNIVNGVNNPSYLFLLKLISLNENINLEWLMTGIGDIYSFKKENYHINNKDINKNGVVLRLLQKIIKTQEKIISVQDILISKIDKK